jgi:serine O-acetyltransferase
VAPSVDLLHKWPQRHPAAQRVIIDFQRSVLGPITVGEGARVGANAVAVADVPAGVTVVGIPAKVIVPRKASQEFRAYGMPTDDIADPITRAIDGLLDQVSRLKARVEQLEGEAAHRAGNGEAETSVTTPASINPEDRHTPDC